MLTIVPSSALIRLGDNTVMPARNRDVEAAVHDDVKEPASWRAESAASAHKADFIHIVFAPRRSPRVHLGRVGSFGHSRIGRPLKSAKALVPGPSEVSSSPGSRTTVLLIERSS